jgi:hypothetical protein
MEICIQNMYSIARHPAIKVSRINTLTKMNPLTETKPHMITRSTTYIKNERIQFRKFTKSQYRINVNELVNAELYNRASIISGETILFLKNSYSPQQIRAFLLTVQPTNYQDGMYVKYNVTAPKKNNRGIDWNIEVGEVNYHISDNDIIGY